MVFIIMFKILIFVSAILAVVLAENKLEQVPFGSESPNAGVEISRSNVVGPLYFIPPDNGGNYGDKMWRQRVQGDSLLTREVLINTIAPGDDSFVWRSEFPGKNITHIRFLNIGRERGWMDEIRCDGGPIVDARIRVHRNKQFRMLYEVYGR